MTDEPISHRRQMLGSLLVAVAIVAIVILAVTVRLGPTSVAEEEARNERLEERLKAQEERLEQRREALEEAGGGN
jgi:type II secretory pathway pseudopilin PulG